MTKELRELINKANETLRKAQGARYAVLEYIEEEYGISDTSGYDYFEDECDWCYGLNERKIEMAREDYSN